MGARVATLLEQDVKNRKPELRFVRECLLGDWKMLSRPHDFHESHWLGLGTAPRYWPAYWPAMDDMTRYQGEARVEASKTLIASGWSFGQHETETVKPVSRHSEGEQGNQLPYGIDRPMKVTESRNFALDCDPPTA